MDVQPWVGPTIAISLVVVASSMLLMGALALALAVAVRRQSRAARAQLAAFAKEAHVVSERFRHELNGFADLSTETRGRLRRAIDTVDERLTDLDALVEVIQEEAEETALDAAALLRTVRRSGSILGAAGRALKRRRKR